MNLYDLYQNLDDEIHDLIVENNRRDVELLTSPFLLKVSDEYYHADIKVMIFGKETNGWIKYEDTKDIDDILDCYDGFYNSGECYTYSGQFWNGFKLLKSMLESIYKMKRISFIWNNIVKIGKNGKGFPVRTYQPIIKPHLNPIITKELDILKPNIIILLTGPNSSNGPYDNVIDDIFNNPKRDKINGFEERQLCNINIMNAQVCLRTYHPAFLYRNDISRYYKTICREVAEKIKV